MYPHQLNIEFNQIVSSVITQICA
ncbi:hypothetical protein P9112_002655 [Eukaryota sp. TZLM1-RC]